MLECVGQEAGDTFRIIVKHTSPSHYEALGKIVLANAETHYQASGPMTPNLLLQWLNTLFERWPGTKTIPWAIHDLDEKPSSSCVRCTRPSRLCSRAQGCS